MRNLPTTASYWRPHMELSSLERNQLSDMAMHRYDLWRSRKHNRLGRDEAYAAALALTRNDAEQRERAFQHDTGATRYAS
jgi:hypothetical protein